MYSFVGFRVFGRNGTYPGKGGNGGVGGSGGNAGKYILIDFQQNNDFAIFNGTGRANRQNSYLQ